MFLVAGLVVWMFFRTFPPKKAVVSNVVRSTNLTLQARTSRPHLIFAISMRIYGEVDGSAAILVTNLMTQHVSGAFDIEIKHRDWYTRTW